MVTTEWAMNYCITKFDMYLGPNNQQGTLISVSLNTVFHETIWKYDPSPIVPLQYVHEDTEIGGYYVLTGSENAPCGYDVMDALEPDYLIIDVNTPDEVLGHNWAKMQLGNQGTSRLMLLLLINIILSKGRLTGCCFYIKGRLFGKG